MSGEGVKEETFRRLRWRCRRGLLELDVWLAAFSANALHDLSAQQCTVLEQLLQESDMELLAWLQARKPVPPTYANLVEIICNTA